VRLEKLPRHPPRAEARQPLIETMSTAGPPQGAKAPSGGREPHAVGERGGHGTAGPPQGAKAPSGGREPHVVGERGGHVGWPAEAIWEAVAPALPGFTVEVLPQVDSTNTELMRRAHAGQCEPVLLVAEVQTAGRGRLGRDWHSDGSSLTFSLGLPLQMADWSGLSLAVGVSVAASLHPALQLKWPNDIWLQQRKLAGILIETASIGTLRYAVIGVGVNITPREALGLATPPAWLQELLVGIDAPQTLSRLAAPLVLAVKRFEGQGLEPFLESFHARDALAGRYVTLSDGTSGQARGVDSSGALLVHTSAGLKKINSAEVSVRPTN
jgi:BirA family biotin operon repressor/biotin-[acetyl-CoA-carboxylase] ligase